MKIIGYKSSLSSYLLGLTLLMFSLSAQALEHSTDLSAFQGSSQSAHEFQFLLSGPEALQARLDLIESAQESIEFEYFVFKRDAVGRLLAQALVERARAGVDVKIMFDHFGTRTQLNNYVIRELIQSGAEVRFYNLAMLRPYMAQFRNHRKFIIVDGEKVLTGGRNISEQYFGVHEEYNLTDRDFILEGEIVDTIRQSFYAYWESDVVGDRANIPGDIQGHNFIRRMRERKAQEFFETNRADRQLRSRLEELTAQKLNDLPTYYCRDIAFATDLPKIGDEGREPESRLTRQAIFERMRATQEKIFIESPYMVFDEMNSLEMEDLVERNVDVTVHTNSLNASNMMPVTAVFFAEIGEWIDRGVNAYIFEGGPVSSHAALKRSSDARWGSHSKTMLFDDETVMLGSFNFDPRSTVWNAEHAIFCRDKELASFVQESVRYRKNYAILLESSEDVEKYEMDDVEGMRRLGYRLLRRPSQWIDFLL